MKFYGLTTPTPDSVFLDPLPHSPYLWFTQCPACVRFHSFFKESTGLASHPEGDCDLGGKARYVP